jgi:2-aminobenzoate-CoA ligase
VNAYTAHVDTFARDRLPSGDEWPEFLFDRPELVFPEQLNCGARLLDDAVAEGHGNRVALYFEGREITYSALLADTNRIANVLMRELGVVPGNRVLLRAPNNPFLYASWLAVMKAGAVAVTTMPLLRAAELSVIASRARIDHALCDARLLDELAAAACASGSVRQIVTFGSGDLEARMTRQPETFKNVPTGSEDVSMLAFTSGTTGDPKATMHFHRDVIAMAEVVGRHLLRTGPDDVYLGSPPLGFTFGLGALLVFPLYFRGAAALIETPSPAALLEGVHQHGVTCLFSAPTMYRAMLPLLSQYNISRLKQCVSAGEPLPKATSDLWHASTGLRIIDGLGTTEMIHIFISAREDDIRPGATGRPLPGYQACVLDENNAPQPPGNSGRLAVKGPTGCRYLSDPRQSEYVVNGWNVTGDRYRVDAEGYFWFESRADDMIVSAGYNIAGPEVELALLGHPAVRECAVIGVPDEHRGNIVKAFIVLAPDRVPDERLRKILQDHVKATIAPYKYPRAIEFVQILPKTTTGKIQRYVLREQELARLIARGPP